MIKNKILNIKIIFKILKTSLKDFMFSNKLLFYKIYYKTVFKNHSQKKNFKTIFENTYQTGCGPAFFTCAPT